MATNAANAYQDCAILNGLYACYNGIPTNQLKTELVMRRGAGIMLWESSMDTTDGTSLVSAIYERAHRASPRFSPTRFDLQVPSGD